MTLPGVAGRQSQYFVRVRSQAEAGTPVDTLDEVKQADDTSSACVFDSKMKSQVLL